MCAAMQVLQTHWLVSRHQPQLFNYTCAGAHSRRHSPFCVRRASQKNRLRRQGNFKSILMFSSMKFYKLHFLLICCTWNIIKINSLLSEATACAKSMAEIESFFIILFACKRPLEFSGRIGVVAVFTMALCKCVQIYKTERHSLAGKSQSKWDRCQWHQQRRQHQRTITTIFYANLSFN